MPILILLTLVPTLTFYFYVLVQFMKEAARRRHHDTCTLIVPLQSENVRLANYSLREFSASRRGESYDSREDAGAAHANVITTHLRNRLVAYQSGAARLAVKRAAKG